MKKRILAVLAVIALVGTGIPTNVSAAEIGDVESVAVGEIPEEVQDDGENEITEDVFQEEQEEISETEEADETEKESEAEKETEVEEEAETKDAGSEEDLITVEEVEELKDVYDAGSSVYSGTIKEGTVFEYTAAETGFYDISVVLDAAKSKKMTISAEIIDTDSEYFDYVYIDIDSGATSAGKKFSCYMGAGKTYVFRCNVWDKNYNDYSCSGSIKLTPNTSDITSVTATKQSKKVELGNRAVFTFKSGEAGLYCLTYNAAVNYNEAEFRFVQTKDGYLEYDGYACTGKYNNTEYVSLEANKDYYIIADIGPGSGSVTSSIKVEKHAEVASLSAQIYGLDQVSSYMQVYDLMNYYLEVTATFKDGTTEIFNNEGSLEEEYYQYAGKIAVIDIDSLKTDDYGFLKAGKQKATILCLDDKTTTLPINVLTKQEIATSNKCKTLSSGGKITAVGGTGEDWYNSYFYRADANGYYEWFYDNLGYNIDPTYFWNGYEVKIYDSTDNEIPFVPGAGWRLMAGETYLFDFAFYNRQRSDRFTFWIDAYYYLPQISKPSISSVENASSGITIKWKKDPEATGYYVYRSDNDGSFKKIKSTTSASYTDTTAVDGVKYAYKVYSYAQDPVDGTVFKSQASSKKIIYRVSKPKSLEAVSASKGIDISWKKISGVTGYKLYRSTNGGAYEAIATVKGASTTTYSDLEAATNGAKYQYKIKAYKSDDTTKYYGVYSSVSTAYYLKKPAIESLTNSSAGKLKIAWAANTKCSGYEIEYSTKSDFSSGVKSVTVADKATVTKTISNLTKDKKYYVRVRSYKSDNGEKYYSIWSSKKYLTLTK